MAKQIRWRVPFASVSGTLYEVEIYDEGWTGSPVVLTAGATPFVTDEDASDDFFAPIRSQTGTLQVCTQLADGTMLRLEDILPDNNIARPVQLRRVDDDVVEWQGFLSCEAYTQDYIGIPQVLDLSLISVLEAMDSVELRWGAVNDINTIRATLGLAMYQFQSAVGLGMIENIYSSAESWNFMNKELYLSLFFEQYTVENVLRVDYKGRGKSIREVLDIICTHIGWTCREVGTSIYFQRIGEKKGMHPFSFGDFDLGWDDPDDSNLKFITTANMADLEWRGAAHKRSVAQGAREISIRASLTKPELSLSLPEVVSIDNTTKFKGVDGSSGIVNKDWAVFSLVNDTKQHSNIVQKFRRIGIADYHGDGYYPTVNDYGTSTHTAFLNNFWNAASAMRFAPSYTSYTDIYLGAVFARLGFNDTSVAPEKYDHSGLLCLLTPQGTNLGTPANPPRPLNPATSICDIMTHNLTLYNGYLRIDCLVKGLFSFWSHTESASVQSPIQWIGKSKNIYITLKFGFGGCWNGSSWQTSLVAFKLPINAEGNVVGNWNESMGIDKTSGYLIPVEGLMQGAITLGVSMVGYSENDYYSNTIQETWQTGVLFEVLNIDFIAKDNNPLNTKDSNVYTRILSANFKEKVERTEIICTSIKNDFAVNLVWDSAYYAEPTESVIFDDGITKRNERPEVNLLNRMAEYYQAARTTISLEVAHPTDAPLPLLRLNGINDGKIYTPIAESRDWQMEVSTITCMETP